VEVIYNRLLGECWDCQSVSLSTPVLLFVRFIELFNTIVLDTDAHADNVVVTRARLYSVRG